MVARRAARVLTRGEVLIAAGVILLLAAVLVPLMSSAKPSIRGSAEISNLHQLAIAGEVYRSNAGAWPLSCTSIVEANLAPSTMMVSPLDNSSRGMANDLAIYLASSCPACNVMPTAYRRTFLGPDDFGHSDQLFRDQIEPIAGAGWLVSLAQSQPDASDSPISRLIRPTGKYLRILLSGAVAGRTHTFLQTPSGPVYSMPFMFADGDDAWKRRLSE
jgi:type II secretory pathway pseudopilin PulG